MWVRSRAGPGKLESNSWWAGEERQIWVREHWEEVEAEEGGEVDGVAATVTRLLQVFVPSKSHKLVCTKMSGKQWLKRRATIISGLTADISLNLLSILWSSLAK